MEDEHYDYELNKWLSEIDYLAQAEGYQGSYTKDTGFDNWMESFNFGVDAATAWQDEKESGYMEGDSGDGGNV